MEGSLVSRMWSVRIQGMDISMGNWIRRPMVSSRKNSLNHSWDKSQHCCRASGKRETGSRKCLNVYRSTGIEIHLKFLKDNFYKSGFNMTYSPLKLSRCVKKKECLWKSSIATTMGPSRLLRRVFLDPLLSAINDSSMVRTMYSCRGNTKVKSVSVLSPSILRRCTI